MEFVLLMICCISLTSAIVEYKYSTFTGNSFVIFVMWRAENDCGIRMESARMDYYSSVNSVIARFEHSPPPECTGKAAVIELQHPCGMCCYKEYSMLLT
jgi:hypothetical protein